VFDNLVVNAIKYTPDGGQVHIVGQRLKGRDDGDWVEVIVSDTGIGIDPEHLDRIFDKFYQTGEVALHSTGRTKFKGGGPGLGLAIAKGIVEAHGGSIWAESDRHDEDQCPGTKFHVLLPVKSRVRVGEISSPFSYARS
jgi:signal transduction histidine kinase